jgi:hypothetical protein
MANLSNGAPAKSRRKRTLASRSHPKGSRKSRKSNKVPSFPTPSPTLLQALNAHCVDVQPPLHRPILPASAPSPSIWDTPLPLKATEGELRKRFGQLLAAPFLPPPVPQAPALSPPPVFSDLTPLWPSLPLSWLPPRSPRTRRSQMLRTWPAPYASGI